MSTKPGIVLAAFPFHVKEPDSREWYDGMCTWNLGNGGEVGHLDPFGNPQADSAQRDTGSEQS